MSFHHAGRAARSRRLRALLGTASVAALALSPMPALAQSNWLAGTNSYTTTGNWDNATPPITTGQSAVFSVTNPGTSAIQVDSAGFIAPDSWTFTSTSAGYTASGMALSFGGSGLIDNASGKTITINNSIIRGSVTQNDATGILVLVGSNTYSGATTINAGTLKAGVSGGLSSSSDFTVNGTLDLNGFTNTISSLSGSGIVTNNGGTAVALSTGGSSSTSFSGTIIDGSKSTALTVGGAGTLTLSNAGNTYTGVTTISNGAKLALSSAGAIANSANVLVSGTFDISGATATVNVVSLSSGSSSAVVALGAQTLSLTNASGTFGGSLTGTSGAVFQINSTGNETLSGNSATYAGGYVVPAGTATLAFGNGELPGTGTISIGAGSQLSLGAASGTTTLVNIITGGGSVSVGGGATYILTSNNNNYSGGTTINAGTLQVGNGGSTGSVGSGAITINAGSLTYNLSGNVTAANNISGNGTLVQAGTGTLSLTGTDTFNAMTINSGGTVQINSTSQGTGTVTDNGTLIFSVSSAYPQSPVISGSGSVTIAGTSTVSYRSAMTYTGATNINAGATLALIAGGGGATGTLAASSGVSDAGTFDISGTTAAGVSIVSLSGTGSVLLGAKTLTITNGSGAFSGVIGGSGGLTISGGGLTLNAAQTYTGGTTIATGANLILGPNGSLAGAVVTNGTLGYGNTGTLTLTSLNATGTGGIAEVGGGTLIVNTNIALTGTSGVTSGTLIVGDINNPTASLAGGVLVGPLGTLEGHGTVKGAVTVLSGGTVKAGASIGTLTVNGTVSLPAGTTFIEEFSNTAGSKLAATGAVTLGGALKLVSDSNTYTSGTDYQFITGSSVNGTFSSVTGAPSGYNTTVQYSASAVDVIIGTAASAPATATTTTTTTTYLFNTYGKTPNQIAAGAALTASSSSAPLYLAVGTVVSTNTAAVPATLGQLAGDIHPSLRSATIEDARMIRDTMLGHMHRDPDGPIVWAAGFGNFGNISDSNAANLGHRSGGFLAGGDIPVAATNNELRLGLSGGYSTDNASTSGHLSTANGNEGHVGGYLSFTADQVHFYAGDDYGFGSVNIARSVGTLGAVLTDSQSQHSNQTFAELGYRLAWDIPLEPYAGIASVSSGQGAFTEAGGIAALSGAKASDSEAFTTLGLRSDLGDPMTWGDAGVTPHLDLGWQHALQKLTPSQLVTFQNTGQSFLVLGVPLSRDAARVKAGIEVNQGPVKLFLDYDGEFAGRVSENGISGGIDWQF